MRLVCVVLLLVAACAGQNSPQPPEPSSVADAQVREVRFLNPHPRTTPRSCRMDQRRSSLRPWSVMLHGLSGRDGAKPTNASSGA